MMSRLVIINYLDSGNNYFINNLFTDFVKMLQAIPMQTAISVARINQTYTQKSITSH